MQDNKNNTVTRGNKRLRNALSSSAVGGIARLVTVLSTFITIPITSSYLGAERFGIWMTISTLSALLAFSDMGIGNGLINLVSHSAGRDNREEIKSHVTNAFVFLCLVCLFLLLTFYIASITVDFSAWFHLNESLAQQETCSAFLIYGICLAVSIPVNIIQKVQIGLQKGYINGIWGMIGSLTTLCSVFIAVNFKATLPQLVGIFVGIPLFISIVYMIIFFFSVGKDLLPQRKFISKLHIINMLKIGSLFLLLQASAALVVSADNLIIASFYGAKAVGDYAITVKIFSVSSILVALLLQPLWPAYSEASARGDNHWVIRAFQKYTLIVIALSILISMCLGFLLQEIAQLWLGRSLNVSSLLVAGLFIWAIVDATNMSIATLLNGLHILKPQIFTSAAFAILVILLKIFFSFSSGIELFPWVTSISAIFICIMPLYFIIARPKLILLK